MATINPISQMRKVKSVSGGNNAITLKTQSDAHREALNTTQGKIRLNPLLFKLAQFTRQFELIKQANARCKETFPRLFPPQAQISRRIKRAGGNLARRASLNSTTQSRNERGRESPSQAV